MPVEEQLLTNSYDALYDSGGAQRAGQCLIIANRVVTKVGFWLKKEGDPIGDITYFIRKMDDTILLSKSLGDASTLTLLDVYYELTFLVPALINEQVRMTLDFYGGDVDNNVRAQRNTDVKAGEFRCYAIGVAWSQDASRDFTYRYTYEEPPAGLGDKSANMGNKMVGAGLI